MPKPKATEQIRKAQRALCIGEIDLGPSEPDVLTMREVAALLGLTINSLSINLWRYSIPHRRLGKRLLFVREQLREWLAGRIEERVWIDPFKHPNASAEYWVRETIDPTKETGIG